MTDEELIEQVARVIYEEYDPWRTVWPWSDLQSDQAGVDQYRRIARAALAAINLPALTAWREAVIDELCSLHIYSAEHDDDPRKAVRDIIEWNQRLALDPAVSAEARALMVRGGEMVKEAAAKHCEQWSSQYREAHKNAQARKRRQEARDFESMEIASAFRAFEIRALSVPAIVEAGDA